MPLPFATLSSDRGLTLTTIRPFDVATCMETLQHTNAAPGVKQQLATVRGPKHVVKAGKTPVLEGKESRRLIDAIPSDTVRDLRDRALLRLRPCWRGGEDARCAWKTCNRPGSGWLIRLDEKGGNQHAMSCHHALAEALHAYIAAGGIGADN